MAGEKTVQATTKTKTRLRILYAGLAIGVILLVVGLIFLFTR